MKLNFGLVLTCLFVYSNAIIASSISADNSGSSSNNSDGDEEGGRLWGAAQGSYHRAIYKDGKQVFKEDIKSPNVIWKGTFDPQAPEKAKIDVKYQPAILPADREPIEEDQSQDQLPGPGPDEEEEGFDDEDGVIPPNSDDSDSDSHYYDGRDSSDDGFDEDGFTTGEDL